MIHGLVCACYGHAVKLIFFAPCSILITILVSLAINTSYREDFFGAMLKEGTALLNKVTKMKSL